MLLRAVVRDTGETGRETVIDVCSKDDFGKVERAAAAWARRALRGMPIYGADRTVRVTMSLGWVQDSPVTDGAAPAGKKGAKHGKPDSSVRRGRSGRRG